jgi:predicted metal-binding transcription factor (methanogenesis marker protein 9)
MRSTHVNSEVDFKAVDFCSVEVQKCNLHEYGVSEKHIETHSSCLLKMSSLVSTYPIVGMPDEMIHTH